MIQFRERYIEVSDASGDANLLETFSDSEKLIPSQLPNQFLMFVEVR